MTQIEARTGRLPPRAFTLLEVLVVVAIIALLVTVLMPGLRSTRRAARSSVCISNLHQCGVALTTYENEYRGYRPRAGTYSSMQWLMLITRQVGDQRRYTHVNQVPVERFPVFQCPARTATLPNPFIDYILNGFDVDGAKNGYPEIQEPTPASDWHHPGDVVMVGDAAFECAVNKSPCPDDPIGADDGTLRQNREHHPAAMKLTDLKLFDVTKHASLDRMDIFSPSQLQTKPGRRAGTVTHLRSFTNWAYADGHTGRVQWLGGRRTDRQWLLMYGVKAP